MHWTDLHVGYQSLLIFAVVVGLVIACSIPFIKHDLDHPEDDE